MARVIQPTADGGSDAFWSTTQLAKFIGDRKDGYLFCTDSGKPLSPRNILQDSLRPTLAKLKQTKMGFHCFRRFRESVLQKSEARGLLVAALRMDKLGQVASVQLAFRPAVLAACGGDRTQNLARNGLISSTARRAKSFSLRVATVRACTGAVATIIASSRSWSDFPSISLAHSRKHRESMARTFLDTSS